MADNGVQVFANSDIEEILSMYFDYDYSSGSRQQRYAVDEVCGHFDISQSELDRMIHLLSYEATHDENGNSIF
jgi:hypothetical protein